MTMNTDAAIPALLLGEAGIAAAKAQLPDMILMDIVMPGLNGFQATRKLRRDPKTQHIPILMVTTKDQDTDREWGMRQGARRLRGVGTR